MPRTQCALSHESSPTRCPELHLPVLLHTSLLFTTCLCSPQSINTPRFRPICFLLLSWYNGALYAASHHGDSPARTSPSPPRTFCPTPARVCARRSHQPFRARGDPLSLSVAEKFPSAAAMAQAMAMRANARTLALLRTAKPEQEAQGEGGCCWTGMRSTIKLFPLHLLCLLTFACSHCLYPAVYTQQRHLVAALLCSFLSPLFCSALIAPLSVAGYCPFHTWIHLYK